RETPSWIMRHPVRILVFHFDAIGPAFRPIRPHSPQMLQLGSGRDLFPTFSGGCLTVHIDHDERQDHFFWVDLINSPQSFHEVRRRINVCSPLTYMREQLREKSGAHCVGTLVIPVDRLSRFIGETGPTRNSRREFMGQIDIFFYRRAFSEFSKATYHLRGRLLKSARGKDTLSRVCTPKA